MNMFQFDFELWLGEMNDCGALGTRKWLCIRNDRASLVSFVERNVVRRDSEVVLS
jgi:hypothetical protein